MRSIVRGLFAALSLSAFACSAQEAPAKYVEGTHYKKVREAQAPADPRRVEVAEFFWYGCPHCFSFDPVVESWRKTKAGDVDFVRYPSTLGRPEGVMHARAFYTAEALNVFDAMHHALFTTIQNDRIPLNNEAQLQHVFNKTTGVLPDVFSGTFNGFAVDSRTRRAEQLARDYGIASVPTLVIGNKYTTSPAMAGGYAEVLKVIDFLVDKVRKERAGR